MLYLVATPIGNLSDITLRAIETLKNCDYILCEDTRRSQILLKHYHIHKPLKSYHKFNEASQREPILHDLQEGKQIALICDAGTPGISDPGADLIRHCVENQLPFVAIPGPCAAIQALSCSGLPTDRFQFWGFLARKENALKQELQTIFTYFGTTICYESSHRLLDTLKLIQTLQPHRQIVVARELTKKFEEIIRGTAELLLSHWQQNDVKGEVVLLFSPNTEDKGQEWQSWTPEEHVQWMEKSYSLSRNEAIKLVAQLRGIPKRQIYQHMHQHKF